MSDVPTFKHVVDDDAKTLHSALQHGSLVIERSISLLPGDDVEALKRRAELELRIAYGRDPSERWAHREARVRRLRVEDVVDCDAARSLYALIRERPGLGVRGLARASHRALGSTLYHLRRLKRAGLVVTETHGRRSCHYPAGFALEDRTAAAILEDAALGPVARALHAAAPAGLSQWEVALRTGRSVSTASQHLRTLAQRLLITRERARVTRRDRTRGTVQVWLHALTPTLTAAITLAAHASPSTAREEPSE